MPKTVVEQLTDLAALKAAGVLSEEEFNTAKQRVLGGGGAASAPVTAQATVIYSRGSRLPGQGRGVHRVHREPGAPNGGGARYTRRADQRTDGSRADAPADAVQCNQRRQRE